MDLDVLQMAAGIDFPLLRNLLVNLASLTAALGQQHQQ